jgi:hypothetical protein
MPQQVSVYAYHPLFLQVLWDHFRQQQWLRKRWLKQWLVLR